MATVNDDTANRELRITKILDAPVELVWEAWTNPEYIAAWWGPDGFTNTIHKMDLEHGGEWQFTMHGPDGKNYPNRSIFREIVSFKKIVFEHFNPGFVATIAFEAKGAQTLLTWAMLFETPEMFDIVVKAHKADEGQKQNVARLEKYLLKMRGETKPGK